MPDKDQAIAWATKVAKSKPPRYTEASRNAANFILDTDMIPREDADAMVAAAYEDAATTDPDLRDRLVANAYAKHRKHDRGARGQLITEWDSIEPWVVVAYADYIREIPTANARAARDRIVAKAVAAERDRCHRLAVLIGERHAGGSVIAAVDDIAAAIRDTTGLRELGEREGAQSNGYYSERVDFRMSRDDAQN